MSNETIPGLFMMGSQEPVGDKQIIAFDLDHTIVKPRGTSVHPTSFDDFEFMEGVIKKFKQIDTKTTEIVIFTNQGAFYKNKARLIIDRLEAIIDASPIALRIFIATTEYWRKPSPAMFEYFMDNYVDYPTTGRSIYVGDAAGRTGDFAATDRMFAMNCDMDFLTPELYFLGRSTETAVEPFCFRPPRRDVYPDPPVIGLEEIIIIVGPPSSGKSTACRNYWPRHIRINQDQLRTRKKCLDLFKYFLLRGYPIAVDNTNPTLEGRAEYLALAEAAGRPVVCCFMTASIELCRHLGAYRSVTKCVPPLPEAAYRFFTSRLVSPATTEGFTRVLPIEFAPINEDVFKYALV